MSGDISLEREVWLSAGRETENRLLLCVKLGIEVRSLVKVIWLVIGLFKQVSHLISNVLQSLVGGSDKNVFTEGRVRVPERPQLHEHYPPIRQIDCQIQRSQKRQPISAERIEQPPFRLIDPRRKEVPMPLPLPEFDARTVSQPAIPSFPTQSSYPTTSTSASASTGEPRKQKRPGLAKYSRMARIPKQSDFEPAAAAAPSYPPSTQYHLTSHCGTQDQYAAALTPQYQPSHDQFAPTPQHQPNNDFYTATPQYQPDSVTQYGDDDRYAAMPLYQEDPHYVQTPQYQTSSMDQYGDNDRYAQTPLYQEEDPRYAQTPQYRDNSRYAETPRYEPGPMPRYGSRPAPAPTSALDEDEMFAAFYLPGAPTASRFASSSSTAAAATGSNSYPLASRIASGGEHGGFASMGGWGGDGEYAVDNMGYGEWEDTGYMGEDRNGFEE